jgi:hypothetical protein
MEQRLHSSLLNNCPNEFSVEREFNDVLKEIAGQAHAAPGGDPVIAAMASQLFHLSLVNPVVHQGIEDVVSVRNAIYGNQGASQIAGIIRSSIMTDQLTQGNQPQTWEHPSQWELPIIDFFELACASEPGKDLAKRADEISLNLNYRFVMTNNFTRGIGDELAMQAFYNERFQDGYKWVDVGAALGEIAKQILAKERYPMDPVIIMDHLGGTILQGTTDNANRLLRQPHRVRQCVAVDLIDPKNDEPTWQWAHGSLRPKSEMNNPEFMKKFDALTREQPNELNFFNGDLVDDKNLQEFYDKHMSEKADIVTMSTMLHQLKKKDRDRMLSIGQELLTDEGLLVIKDFTYVQSGSPRSPRFFRHWHHPGRYRMLILDKTDPRRSYQEMYRAKDSRNLVLAAGSGRIAVKNGTALTFNQLIDQSV